MPDTASDKMRDNRHARRMAYIQPFHVMEVLAQAKARERDGHDVIHLEVGEPDFPSPPAVVAAGLSALQKGKTRYTPALGLPELRARIATQYPADIRPDAERIAVVPGSSAALQIAFAILLNPGDEVLLSDPGYPCNANFVRLYEGVPVTVPCTADSGYQLTAEAIRARWTTRTKAVLIGSPANPTGTIVSPEKMTAIAQTVRELGGTLIVDEIYHGLVYGHDVRTALHDGSDIFVVNSFSKYYGMTGWRLGWLVSPDAYRDDVNRLCQNLFIAAPTVSQYAALAAFDHDTLAELEQRRRAFQHRRDFLVPALRALGFKIPALPQGAFYIYADVSAHTENSEEFAKFLLKRTDVAITPGRDFGSFRHREHVRFSYANTMARLEQAIVRLKTVLTNAW